MEEEHMSAHLQFQVHDGFAAWARVIARLHALAVAVDEVHGSGDRICLHLADHTQAPRVRMVLDRCADTNWLALQTDAPCRRRPAPVDPARTGYVVWSEPADAFHARQRHAAARRAAGRDDAS